MDFIQQAAQGSRLKRAARIKGISLVTLSHELRIPYTRLLRLLNGQRAARDGELRAIARALRVDLSKPAPDVEGVDL